MESGQRQTAAPTLDIPDSTAIPSHLFNLSRTESSQVNNLGLAGLAGVSNASEASKAAAWGASASQALNKLPPSKPCLFMTTPVFMLTVII